MKEIPIEIEYHACGWMIDFNFDWRLIGTLYLCNAIAMAIEEGEPFLARSFTKDILPSIAMRHNTSWQAVERSMRYAIESAWLRSYPDVLALYFPQDFEKTGRPSVSQFVREIGIRAYQDFIDKKSVK
jgi:two-component system response regulator (stage 0 sporulation protein A)